MSSPDYSYTIFNPTHDEFEMSLGRGRLGYEMSRLLEACKKKKKSERDASEWGRGE